MAGFRQALHTGSLDSILGPNAGNALRQLDEGALSQLIQKAEQNPHGVIKLPGTAVEINAAGLREAIRGASWWDAAKKPVRSTLFGRVGGGALDNMRGGRGLGPRIAGGVPRILGYGLPLIATEAYLHTGQPTRSQVQNMINQQPRGPR
jgi:hypothetical protein